MDNKIENGPPNKSGEPTSFFEKRLEMLVNERVGIENSISDVLKQIEKQGRKPVFLNWLKRLKQELDEINQALNVSLVKTQETENEKRKGKREAYGNQLDELKKNREDLEREGKGLADPSIVDLGMKITSLEKELKKIEAEEIEEKLRMLRQELSRIELDYKVLRLVGEDGENEETMNLYIEKLKEQIKKLETDLAGAKGMLGSTRDDQNSKETE